MTRPTQFSRPFPQGVGIPGGDPDLPAGQPSTDCCEPPEDQPDRALDTTVFIGTVSYEGFAEVIADGPEFYFLLGEPSGSFADSSTNGRTLTENGGTVTRSVSGGPAGTLGISTTGSPVYLETNFDPPGTNTQQTLEAWIKTTSTGHISLFNSRRTFGVGFFLDIGATGFGSAAGQVSAYINATSLWQGKHSTATVNDGNLHHIAAKWSGTNGVVVAPAQMTIYIDGVPVSTTNDAGNTGSQNAPINGDVVALLDTVSSGSLSVWGQAMFTSALSDARILAHADTSGETVWIGAGPEITDDDDATYTEVTGTGVLRIDLGAAFEIARVRLLIGTETAGARSYTLYGANEADFSDAVLVTTLAFTATGSFTADDVTDSWTPTDAYEFWELDGDDETRNIYSFELYEAGAGDATAVAAALDDHLADTTDAHDASAVSIVDSGAYYTGTDVEAALQEAGADIAAHLADAADAHDASAVSIVDAGGYFTGTDVEAALQELGAGVAISEPVEVVAISGTAVTLDYDVAHWWDITLTANCTLSITNPPADQVAGELIVILRQGGVGSFTVTWPGTVDWQDTDGTGGGAAPTLWTAVGAINVVTLTTVDGGITWGGSAPSGTSTPSGAAGGDLSGTYPNPSVVDDSHNHTAATLPLTSGAVDHEHVQNVVFSGDGSTTVWELPAAPVSDTGVSVYVTGSRSIAWVLSGTLLTTLTFDSAPASAANNIVIDIVAATA